jgi:hypothetical protein
MRQTARYRFSGKISGIAAISILAFSIHGSKTLCAQAAEKAGRNVSQAAQAPVAQKKGKAVKKTAADKKPDMRKIMQKVDLLVEELEAGRPNYDELKKTAGDIESLPADQIDKVFSRAVEKHPNSQNELNIAWARILIDSNQCVKALKKISGIPKNNDPFWENGRLQTLEKCKAK